MEIMGSEGAAGRTQRSAKKSGYVRRAFQQDVRQLMPKNFIPTPHTSYSESIEVTRRRMRTHQPRWRTQLVSVNFRLRQEMRQEQIVSKECRTCQCVPSRCAFLVVHLALRLAPH